MGAPHQFDGVKTLRPRAPSRSRRKPALDGSVVERHFLFWLAVLVLVVLAFGYLFGFVGLLVAVPLAATIGVLTRFALRHYLQSSLYTGEEAD